MKLSPLVIALFISICSISIHSQATEPTESETVKATRKFANDSDVAAYEQALRKLSARGEEDATMQLASYLCLRKGECEEAIRMVRPLADQGNAVAQYNLAGMLFMKGDANGMSYLEKSAKQGNQKAIVLKQALANASSNQKPITTSSVLAQITDLLKQKSESLSPQVLQCYRKTKAELQAITEKYIPSCSEKTVSTYGDTEIAVRDHGREIGVAFATCINSATFKEIGVTPTQLANCLPTK